MSEVITNMKVRFGADTKQFKKGMNDGRRATQQFKKDAGNAIESFANQFGLSLGPLGKLLTTTTAGTKGLSAAMKAGATSTNIFTVALKLFKTALISTGIGALIVGLGTLIAYFTQTQRGADAVKKVMAGFRAIIDVLIDRASAFGEGIFKIFTGKFREGWAALKQSAKGVGEEIKNEAAAAWELEKALQAVERKSVDFIRTKQRLRDEISELILKTRDENIAGNERLKYIVQAQKLQKELSATEISIAEERARILKEQQALGENMIEDDRQLAEAEANVNALRKEGNDKLRELVNRYTEMTNKINASTKAIIAQRQELTKGFKPIESKTTSFDLSLDTSGLETDKLLAGLKTNLGEAQKVVTDFGQSFTGTFNGLAVSFGESMGSLLAGTGGFEDFGKIILGSLGDLAIQIGKIAIGAGVAVLGIKEALLSLNPAVAIAGGIALVALGSAVKGSLSNAASGGGTFSNNSGVYDTRTNFGSTRTPIAQAQPITVHLTGEFRQRGSDMVATIDETNRQNGYRG